MDAQELIQERLRQRYLELKLKNTRASIRSFARQLRVPAGTISLVLLGKRIISRKLAAKLSSALDMDPMELAQIAQSFARKKNRIEKNSHCSFSIQKTLIPDHLRLSADQFHVIKDWHNFAILNLIQTDDFEESIEWISKRLNINTEIVAVALERMARLGLTIRDSKGRLRRKHRHLNTTDEIKDLTLRSSHYQSLELAKSALDERDLHERDFTWLTLPVDFSRLPEMKLMVREFQDQFIQKFGQEQGANEVARMCVQLFPLTIPRAAAQEMPKKNQKKTLRK